MSLIDDIEALAPEDKYAFYKEGYADCKKDVIRLIKARQPPKFRPMTEKEFMTEKYYEEIK
ncbi:MAG: hypothetical protein EOM59_11660 [Clostridia bacterium]|nr:hypothetical protein [Clostridia bacterium]